MHPLDPIFFCGLFQVHDELFGQLHRIFFEVVHIGPELVDLLILPVHGWRQVPSDLEDAFLALFPIQGFLAGLATGAHLLLHQFEGLLLHCDAYVLQLLLVFQSISIDRLCIFNLFSQVDDFIPVHYLGEIMSILSNKGLREPEEVFLGKELG